MKFSLLLMTSNIDNCRIYYFALEEFSKIFSTMGLGMEVSDSPSFWPRLKYLDNILLNPLIPDVLRGTACHLLQSIF